MSLVLRIMLVIGAAFALLHGVGVFSQRATLSIDGKPPSAVRIFPPREPSDDPRADAVVAIRLGDFRLIGVNQMPGGVSCFTPGGQADGMLLSMTTGDYITPDVAKRSEYAARYNQAIVESPDYPAADICRTAGKSDPYAYPGVVLVDRAARIVARPPVSLHEAARRGSAEDVRKFLRRMSVETVDGTGMTALGWATARGNLPAIDALLAAGANPWAGWNGERRDAIYWSIATGRQAIFEKLRQYPAPPEFDGWQPEDLSAAMNSGNVAIIETILREKHRPLRLPYFDHVRPSAAAIEPVLRDQPKLADDLLTASLRRWDGMHLDLLQLALRYGADPDASVGYGETALGLAARGYYDGSEQAIDLLLKAGADIDKPSVTVPVDPERPIWVAVNTMTLGERGGSRPIYDRAQRIVEKLAAAGANLNLPNKAGRPPIWFLLAPATYAPEEISGSSALPDIVRLMVRLGMNPNARWRGQTILPLVEKQLGRDAPTAVTLRDLGAR